MTEAKAKGRKAKIGQGSPIQDEKYRLLFESSSDAIMLLDRERFFDCNKATLDMFGLTKEEFIKRHPSEISPPKQANGKSSREEADRRISEAYEKGINKFEWVHRRSNGQDFPATVWLTAFPLEGRKVLQATVREVCHTEEAHLDLEAHRLKLQLMLDEKSEGMRKEVFERRRAETEVKRLIKAVEGSFNAIGLFDLQLNLMYANHAFCRMAQIHESEIKSWKVTDFIDPAEKPTVLDYVKKTIAGREPELLELKAFTSDGQELWIQIASSVLYGDDGAPEGLLAIVNDMTERKKMLDSLKQSEDKFKTMVEHSVDGIVIVQDGKVVYMNPSLVKLSGYTLEEQLGRDIAEDLVPEEKKKITAAYQARMKGKPIPHFYETAILRKDGKKVPVEINATMMNYLGKPSDFVYVRDLTERRMAERDVRTIKDQFEYVLGATKTGFDIIDEDLNVLYVDPEWAKRLGDYSGRKCYEYFMGTKQMCEGCAIPKAIKTDQKVISEEYLQKEKRHIEVHTIPMKDENGNAMVAEFNIDITERKKNEETLRRSEGQLRNITDSMLDVVCHVDLEGDIVYLSPSVKRVLGYSISEMKRHPFRHYMHPEDLDIMNKLVAELARATGSGKAEFRVRNSKGEYIWIEALGRLMVSDSGQISGALFGIRDISERRHAEEALRVSEEKFRNLAEFSPNMIFINKDGKIVYTNRICEELLGYTREEFLSADFDLMTIIHPEYRKLIRDNLQKHFRGEDIPSYEYKLITKDGKSLDSIISTKVIDIDGKPSIIGIVTDTTPLKKAEQILRESEGKYKKLMESANDAIFLANAKTGVLIDANERACQLIGRSRFEIIGMHQTELHPPEKAKKYEKMFKAHVKEGQAIAADVDVIHKDGHIIPVSISASIFEIGGLLVNQGIFHDLTDRILAEKALRESDEKIRSLFTSMEDLVFGFDAEGIFIQYQCQKKSLLYVPPDVFMGKKYSEVLPPNLCAVIEKGLKANRKKRTSDFEYSLVMAGQEMWFSAKMTPVFLEGKYSGSVAVVRDITEKKATEKALQASEQVYRSLYESTMALGETRDVQRIMEVIAEQARFMLDGECSTIYLWDSEKEVLIPYYSNAKTERDKFMEYQIPLGTGLTGRVAKNIGGAYANYNDPKAKKGYVPGTKTITDHLQSIIAEPMLEDGKLLGVINVIAQERVFNNEDLNKLRILAKQAAIAYLRAKNLDELLKSEERFRKMGDSMHDGLIIIENGVSTYINERAIEIYGYPLEEMKAINHLDLVIPEEKEQLLHVLRSFKDTGKTPGEIEFWIQRKDGSRRYIRTRVSTMREGKKTSQFIITTDITDRKLAEDENKRKVMKYLLEDGRIYLVKEFKPAMTLEALNDLLNLDYIGLVISRTPKKDMLRSITGSFEHLWLGEQMESEELFAKILSSIDEMKGKGVIMIDRLDYVIFKHGFKETLGFIFRLRDQIYLREQVVIVSIDPSTLKEDELNIMQKEMSEIELRQIPRPGEELIEIAQLIYDKNSTGIKPSFSEIGEELSLSKPTFRKRVRRLISSGYAVEVTKGNRKVLELTQKGRSLFFK